MGPLDELNEIIAEQLRYNLVTLRPVSILLYIQKENKYEATQNLRKIMTIFSENLLSILEEFRQKKNHLYLSS